MKIFFRADANKNIGQGHVMRCLSVADAFAVKGAECSFICAKDSYTETIEQRGYPVVRLENGEFVAYGVPWSGKSDLSLNLRVPIGGICQLRRGEKNTIRKMNKREALFSLLGQTVRPKDAEGLAKVMDLLNGLLAQVDVWEMHCNMDPEAAVVSYEAMSGARKENTT